MELKGVKVKRDLH